MDTRPTKEAVQEMFSLKPEISDVVRPRELSRSLPVSAPTVTAQRVDASFIRCHPCVSQDVGCDKPSGTRTKRWISDEESRREKRPK